MESRGSYAGSTTVGTRLPVSLLAAYGAPAIAMAILLLPPYVFIPAFYTQTLGLPLDMVGYIIVASRLFDAVSDPLIGFLSDRTPGPWGRRKPWIVAGTPLAIASVYILFVPPAIPSLELFAVGLFGMTLAWTMLTLPYNAWGAELSGDYHERTRIAGFREGIGLFGTLIAASAPTALTAAGYTDPRIHMAALAAVIALLLVPTVAWAVTSVPEPAPLTRNRLRWSDGLSAIVANGPFRRLILAYVINAFANGLPATLFVLFVSHVIGEKDAYGPLLLAYFLAGLVAIPFWSLLARRIGKHRTWVVAMTLACAAFICTPFVVGPGDIVPFLVICVISGMGVGADMVLPSAIQADVVDADTQASGEQRTGLYFALWAMATKLALALSALALPVLAAVGFDAEAFDASGKTMNGSIPLLALSLLYAGLPVVIKLIAMALMWNFPIDEESQRRIRSDIEENGG